MSGTDAARPKRAYRKTSETQKIIFDKAMMIMSEKGFQGTTVRDICAEAHIPIGTFYNCFKSKVDILKTIFDSGDRYMLEAVRSAQPANALEHLKLFAHHYAKLNETTGIEVMRVLFYPANDWFAQVKPMQSMARDIVLAGQAAGEIRMDMSADFIVAHMFDIFRGVCYNWCVYNGTYDLSRRIQEHFNLFCDVIKAKE